jgi:hypothetical protein
MAILGTENGIVDFAEPRKMANTQAPIISVFNKTGVPQHLALCISFNPFHSLFLD